MERSEELDVLEAEIRGSAKYMGWRDRQHADHDKAMQALYVGLCIRELCDTLTGRVARDA